MCNEKSIFICHPCVRFSVDDQKFSLNCIHLHPLWRWGCDYFLGIFWYYDNFSEWFGKIWPSTQIGKQKTQVISRPGRDLKSSVSMFQCTKNICVFLKTESIGSIFVQHRVHRQILMLLKSLKFVLVVCSCPRCRQIVEKPQSTQRDGPGQLTIKAAKRGCSWDCTFTYASLPSHTYPSHTYTYTICLKRGTHNTSLQERW